MGSAPRATKVKVGDLFIYPNLFDVAVYLVTTITDTEQGLFYTIKLVSAPGYNRETLTLTTALIEKSFFTPEEWTELHGQ